jgi:hemolysin activation/secretion protein
MRGGIGRYQLLKSRDKLVRSLLIIIIVATVVSMQAVSAVAQTALHLISPNPLSVTQPLPKDHASSVAPGSNREPAALGNARNASFILSAVQFEGVTVISKSALGALQQGLIGKTVSSNDIVQVGKQLSKLYETAGYVLINVLVPEQNFVDGIARIVVQEGYVDRIVIEGNTDGVDLDLLKAYAAHIITDRPLRQRTLQRYVLLMNDIPGLKVGSKFEPVPGHLGVAALHLVIQRRHFESGGALTNQGNNQLGSSQLTMNVVGDSLLHQGDQTQAVIGVPLNLTRYQYFGLDHSEPLGTDGATITVGGGRLITHPSANQSSGTADTLIVRVSYPIIRALHESLVANGDFNYLNSNSAFLGQSLSDERTRSFRLGAIYGLEDGWKGTTIASGTISQGFDILGARRGSEGFGGPGYTKFNGSVAREQAMPLDLVLRAKVFWQYSADRLPNTEQFLFGGPDIGKAFNYAFLAGDRGVAPYLELAHPWPIQVMPDVLGGSEVFSYLDWGQAWHVVTPVPFNSAQAASAGFGTRAKLMKSIVVELGAGWVLNESPGLPSQSSPRLIFNVSGHF